MYFPAMASVTIWRTNWLASVTRECILSTCSCGPVHVIFGNGLNKQVLTEVSFKIVSRKFNGKGRVSNKSAYMCLLAEILVHTV